MNPPEREYTLNSAPANRGEVHSDIITDDLDNRYVVSSAELTDLGYRLTAGMVVI